MLVNRLMNNVLTIVDRKVGDFMISQVMYLFLLNPLCLKLLQVQYLHQSLICLLYKISISQKMASLVRHYFGSIKFSPFVYVHMRFSSSNWSTNIARDTLVQ